MSAHDENVEALVKSYKSTLWKYIDRNPQIFHSNNLHTEMVPSIRFNFLEKLVFDSQFLLVYIKESKTSTPLGIKYSEASDVNIEEKNNEESVMDFLGQPLEAPFNLSDLKKTIREESETFQLTERNNEMPKNLYIPLPTAFARTAVSVFSATVLSLEPLKCRVPLLCGLCDGSDKDKTEMLGVQRVSENEIMTFSVKKVEGSVVKDLPTLAILKSPEYCFYPKQSATITEKLWAIYDFSYGLNKLYIECFWNEANEILNPPSNDADCYMRVKLVLGQKAGPLQILYKQLSFLETIAKALETNEMEWAAESKVEAMSKIQDLISSTNESRNRFVKQVNIPPALDEIDFCIENIIISNKVIGDFTAQLWDALLYCQSLKELEEGLSMVCELIRKGELHPQLKRNNMTKLAIWIRKIYEGSISEHISIKGSSALALLAEIGIAKLWDDYCAAYQRLSTTDLLKEHFTSSDLGFSQSVDSLIKIHYALEFVVSCQNNLRLESFHLSNLTRRILNEITSHIYRDGDELFFPFSVLPIQSILNRSRPETWEFDRTVTEKDEFSFRTILLLSQDRSQKSAANSISAENADISGLLSDDANHKENVKYSGRIINCTTNTVN